MTSRNWNDGGASKGRKSKGIGSSSYLNFKTMQWEPYKQPARVTSACCVCGRRIKLGTPQALVFSVQAHAHWGCFVRLMNNPDLELTVPPAT